MTSFARSTGVCAVVFTLSIVGSLGAQQLAPTQLAAAGPRFLSPPAANGPVMDMSNAPVLQRRISLEMDRVPLGAALREVAKLARMRFAISREIVPVDKPVTVHADGITVGGALFELLTGTGLDVELAVDGSSAALIPRVRAWIPARGQSTGTITGHVTDSALKAPLSEVTVRVEGTALRTTANADGKYTIARVAPGTYRITARRVGYQPLTKEVTLAGDQIATLDFPLAAAPTRLDEVVTTAVGEQRRYQVGNDISTINADSIAPTAPITSLTDLISARAPGVTVLETSGLTGAGEAIRIEGLTSLVLQNDPILIVDGVRQDNSAGGDLYAYGFSGASHPTPTRLNDIDFSDIQTIDILKGPSASTEYGTDAANGVIVITTKHGTAGRPQWKASAEQTESGIPVHFGNNYYSWGHETDGTNTPVNCILVPPYGGAFAQYGSPYNIGSTAGTCVVDSVTTWNPFNHAATTLFGTGNRGKYDLSVSGGSESARYFVAGGLSNETGMVHMPSVFRELADTAALGIPAAAFNSNTEQQRSVRVSTAITLAPTLDLTTTASYLSTYQETPNAGQLYEGVFDSPAIGNAANYYGYGAPYLSPISMLSELGSQQTDRMTGGLTMNWRPVGWFVGHATAGVDHGSQREEAINYPLTNSNYSANSSSLGLVDATTDLYSVDLRGTATASVARNVGAVTSGGVQMVDSRLVGQTAFTNNITPTNLTLNGATAPTVTQQGNRQATLGGYGEEQISVADRLFVTGALRLDAASGFGGAYATALYPKTSVSWLALNTAATTVRLRGAFGESGVQPMNGAALQLYSPNATYLSGGAVSTATLMWPGNPNLRPERSAEFEGGADVSGWGNRVSVEVTGYAKTTHDALVNQQLGVDIGGYTYQENIGEVRNTGLEASATIGLVATRKITWDVAVNASMNHNTLISLAPGVAAQPVLGAEAAYRQAPGYPLYGIWAPRETYRDVNDDGIIEASEVTLSDSETYVGPSMPTQEVSISTHLGLWHGAVSVGGLVDYRGGYRIANVVQFYADQAENGLQSNEPTAPLASQARAVANAIQSGTANYSIVAPDAEDGSFVRIREVSLTYEMPHSWVRAMRVNALSVTGAVRNLALWTRYGGVDPEVNNTGGGNAQAVPNMNIYAVNNDVREDVGGVPLARYWVVRLNVGW
jgi:TonB-linked SusC/RagA family outer membrane protein